VVNNLTVLGTFTGGNLATGALGTATSSTNYNSQNLQAVGSYYNASTLAAASDSWSFQNVLGTGTSPTSTLTIGHTGTAGISSVSIPYPTTLAGLTVTGVTNTFTSALIANTLTAGQCEDGVSGTITALSTTASFSVGLYDATSPSNLQFLEPFAYNLNGTLNWSVCNVSIASQAVLASTYINIKVIN
jgi:hypothetical protein